LHRGGGGWCLRRLGLGRLGLGSGGRCHAVTLSPSGARGVR
jgi:hypothetical protein